MENAWVVRAGGAGENEENSLNSGRIYVNWPGVGDISQARSFDEVRDIVRNSFPEESNHLIGNWAGQLNKFKNEMQIGDLIVLPLKNLDKYAIGIVSGEYIYDESDDISGFRHSRKVEWKDKGVDKNRIKPDLRQSLGTLLTVARIGRVNAYKRLLAVSLGGDGCWSRWGRSVYY